MILNFVMLPSHHPWITSNFSFEQSWTTWKQSSYKKIWSSSGKELSQQFQSLLQNPAPLDKCTQEDHTSTVLAPAWLQCKSSLTPDTSNLWSTFSLSLPVIIYMNAWVCTVTCEHHLQVHTPSLLSCKHCPLHSSRLIDPLWMHLDFLFKLSVLDFARPVIRD